MEAVVVVGLEVVAVALAAALEVALAVVLLLAAVVQLLLVVLRALVPMGQVLRAHMDRQLMAWLRAHIRGTTTEG